MKVGELITLLRQCDPGAQVALVDTTGIFALTGVQQSPNRDAVFLSHSSTGFEAERVETPREAGIAGDMYRLSDAEVMRRIRKRGGTR